MKQVPAQIVEDMERLSTLLLSLIHISGSWAVAVAIIGLIGSIWYRYAASKKNATLERKLHEQEQVIAAMKVALELLKSKNQQLQDQIDEYENTYHERKHGHGISR